MWLVFGDTTIRKEDFEVLEITFKRTEYLLLSESNFYYIEMNLYSLDE